MAGDKDEVLIRTEGRLCLITINRPEVRNARDKATNLRMMDTIIDADHDPAVSMIAITGAGDKAFCAGADLKAARSQFDVVRHFRGPLDHPERTLMEVILDARKPVMAIVNGPAIAGGFELALSCDLRVAADTAFFAVPEAKRGRGAHFASVVLPQIVPPAIAHEWLFTGRRVPVQEAERWGLINRYGTRCRSHFFGAVVVAKDENDLTSRVWNAAACRAATGHRSESLRVGRSEGGRQGLSRKTQAGLERALKRMACLRVFLAATGVGRDLR